MDNFLKINLVDWFGCTNFVSQIKIMKKYEVEFVVYSVITTTIEIEDDEKIEDYIYPEMDIDITEYLNDIHNSGVDKINDIKEV